MAHTLNPPTFCGFFYSPSSTLPPPPTQGFSGYHTSLIQTSWGFFHRANYRQLGAQRITFSVQGKAGAGGERTGLDWNTQILICVCACHHIYYILRKMFILQAKLGHGCKMSLFFWSSQLQRTVWGLRLQAGVRTRFRLGSGG